MSYVGMPAKSSSGILQAFASASSKKVGSQIVSRQALLAWDRSDVQGGPKVTAHTQPFNNSRNLSPNCTQISETIDMSQT